MSEQPPDPRNRDQFINPPQQPPQGQQPLPPPMYQYPPHDAYGPRQPAYAPPKKKHNGLWIAVAVVLVVGVVTCGVIGMASSGTTKVATDTTSTSSSPPAPGKWTTTHTFSGNGIKKTETFTVPDDWKIAWSCQGTDIGGTAVDAVLAVTVTDSASNAPVDAAVNATCKAGKTTSDVTEEHQSGSIFLDVNATGDWTLKVQELK